MGKTILFLTMAFIALNAAQAQERTVLPGNHVLRCKHFKLSKIERHDDGGLMIPVELAEGCYSVASSVPGEDFLFFCINENGQIDGEVKVISRNSAGKKCINTCLFDNGFFVKSKEVDVDGKKIYEEFVTDTLYTRIHYNYPRGNRIVEKRIVSKNDVMNAHTIKYYDNGKVYSEHKDGVTTTYFKNGKVQIIQDYNDSIYVWRKMVYNKKGELVETTTGQKLFIKEEVIADEELHLPKAVPSWP